MVIHFFGTMSESEQIWGEVDGKENTALFFEIMQNNMEEEKRIL